MPCEMNVIVNTILGSARRKTILDLFRKAIATETKQFLRKSVKQIFLALLNNMMYRNWWSMKVHLMG